MASLPIVGGLHALDCLLFYPASIPFPYISENISNTKAKGEELILVDISQGNNKSTCMPCHIPFQQTAK